MIMKHRNSDPSKLPGHRRRCQSNRLQNPQGVGTVCDAGIAGLAERGRPAHGVDPRLFTLDITLEAHGAVEACTETAKIVIEVAG